MALSTQPYKGARDFYPEDKRLQKYMFRVMRQVAERFGYEEYDAPILEPTDLFTAKGNQEIVDEQTYTFKDRGDRSVTIRTEMTPSASRMVAGRRQELAYPLRWYSIPNLWRYERTQRGRLREFWQLNVDIFGASDIEADLEIIMIADQILKSFGANHKMYTIKLNSRELIDYIMRVYLGFDEVQTPAVCRVIDRKAKMEHAEFVAQIDAICTEVQRAHHLPDQLNRLLEIEKISKLPAKLYEHSSVKKLEKILEDLKDNMVTNASFDISVMRGFDYYNDVVFEVFDNHPDNNRSMFGGGRYDGLVSMFGVEPVPTVGFGMGDVTLQNFLEVHDLAPMLRPETDVYAVLIGDVYEKAQKVLAELRADDVNVAVDFTGRKPAQQIKTADKKGVHYVIFIGEEELEEEVYTIRNLRTGEEEKHSLQRIVSIVKDYRQQ